MLLPSISDKHSELNDSIHLSPDYKEIKASDDAIRDDSTSHPSTFRMPINEQTSKAYIRLRRIMKPNILARCE
jgi:hypothetical protein